MGNGKGDETSMHKTGEHSFCLTETLATARKIGSQHNLTSDRHLRSSDCHMQKYKTVVPRYTRIGENKRTTENREKKIRLNIRKLSHWGY